MCSWNMNFCKNLCYLRQKHRLRTKDMAEIPGVGISTYRKIEQCDETVRLRSGMLVRVCDYFQVSADGMLRKDIQTETDGQ